MVSILHNKVFVTIFTGSLDQIILLVTSLTLFQILRREGFVTGALFYWIVLTLKIFQLIINRFTTAVICNPILTCIIIWFFVDLLALVGFVDIFLLVLTRCTLLGTDIEHLTTGTGCTWLAVLWEGFLGRTLFDGDIVVFKLLDPVFILLLGYRTPNIRILSWIDPWQILRYDFLLLWIPTLVIDLQKYRAIITLINTLIFWNRKNLSFLFAFTTLAVNHKRCLFGALH